MHTRRRCLSVSEEISPQFNQKTSQVHVWHQLEQLSIHVEAKYDRKRVYYDIHVTHRLSNKVWIRCADFNEHCIFVHKVLLPTMQHGHFCDAECPWIYSYVLGTFPQTTWLFPSSSKRLVRRRQEALKTCLTQVHQYLLNKNNYRCPVTQEVALKFLSFILGNNAMQAMEVLEQTHELTLSASERKSNDSFNSISSEVTSDEEHDCLICNQLLVERDSCCYTIVLSCGHEFHEECIIKKLNETVGCPVCRHTDI